MQKSIGVLSSDIFLGRQPIFDRQMNVAGYELLYRAGDTDHSEFADADEATAQIILTTFAEISLEKIVGAHKAYINLAPNFYLGKYPIPFRPDQVVLEIPGSTRAGPEIVLALQKIKKRGYQIALDGVAAVTPILPFLEVMDVIKVDLRLANPDGLAEMVAILRRHGVLLVAEKVETPEEFQRCRQLGFHYFQGFFLSRPALIQERVVAPSRLVVLQMIGKLQDPDVAIQDLAELVSQDLALSHKLFKLVNSGYYNFPVQIRSIRQALTILGMDQLRSWLTLFLLAKIVEKPSELTALAMARARMCELLAQQEKLAHPETYFLTGLFSLLEAFLDQPMDRAIDALALSPDVKEALLHRSGPLGVILRCALAYEKADWDEIKGLGWRAREISSLYLESLRWVSRTNKMLAA